MGWCINCRWTFNSLPVIRDRLLQSGPARDCVVQWVDVPSLEVTRHHRPPHHLRSDSWRLLLQLQETAKQQPAAGCSGGERLSHNSPATGWAHNRQFDRRRVTRSRGNRGHRLTNSTSGEPPCCYQRTRKFTPLGIARQPRDIAGVWPSSGVWFSPDGTLSRWAAVLLRIVHLASAHVSPARVHNAGCCSRGPATLGRGREDVGEAACARAAGALDPVMRLSAGVWLCGRR